MESLYKHHSKPSDFIPEELFRGVLKTLDSAVSVEFQTEYPELCKLIADNNEVFTAFKVHDQCERMARLLTGEDGQLLSFREWAKLAEPIADHHNRVWLRTEYDTAVRRAQLARDWTQFREEKDVFPNLRWVPSTAVTPEADHIVFWNTVRPVDDEFWSAHRPGDRWGCQCSLEATDDPATDVPDTGDVFQAPDPGLDNNPADDGRLFSDSHPYFPDSCATCPFNTGEASPTPTNKARDCVNCALFRRCIAAEKGKFTDTAKVYQHLINDPNYTDVAFDQETGALKATHKNHNKDIHGWAYEEQALNAGFSRGDCIIFGSEKDGQNKQRFVEGTWNGMNFEVAGCETATVNNIRNGLKHCASKRITDIAVLVFPDQPFNVDTFKEGFRKYSGLEKLKDGQHLKFKRVICVRDDKVIYEIDL